MSFDDCASSVPFEKVLVTSDFWLNRVDAVRMGSIPAMYAQMKETGRWDSLKLGWKPGKPNKPHRFWDSDVAKWLEAACYSLVLHPDAELAKLVEEAVDLFRGAQQDDGYLNTYYTVVEPGKRWTNIAWSHEMYCAGHLLEAALAHYTWSQSTRLLDPALKYIAHIRATFGLGEGQKKGYPGHQEIELALLKAHEQLASAPAVPRATVDMLLELANYLIEERGQRRPEGHYYDVEAAARGEEVFPGPTRRGGEKFSYYQAEAPVREIKSAEGHAVRVGYWLTAVAGLARLTRDESLVRAAERLWKSVMRKMYVTGGVGAMGDWEGFGPDHFLPNETGQRGFDPPFSHGELATDTDGHRGYLETCAAIALVLFAHQMLLLSPRNAEYGNVLELALYNGVLVGMSLDGKSFFYDNPTATIGAGYERSKWFEVSCCPPNVARLVNSLGKYIYTLGADDTVHVHLYISSFTDLVIDGTSVRVRQEASSPWATNASATFVVESAGDKTVRFSLRKPLGADDFKITAGVSAAYIITVNDDFIQVAIKGGRAIKAPVAFTVNWTYRPRRLHPHPLTLDNRGSVAFARGPFVYCAESVDNAAVLGGDLRALRVPDDAPVREISGARAFAGSGLEPKFLRTTALVVSEEGESCGEELPLTLVPVFMWANRGPSEFRVWLPREVHRDL
ncbi:DUF1680-domain-containing protein [Punctularia strigosozonata HHB-11173 SS5]|uniref:DUF1680-domain-containing protein n=1 Tax=Punctularia strigosozonata (strain HHB-11173) TaxID=741275 RepID=UPI000441854E|nr:DUF1680-domain-containing protein [Punctularia strigosozonata HHB-11173 SS5]EIN07779.1 DUF1680-domain-containing protein [Punctularia strigosozonata HHB-11173 SS5]